MSRDYEDLVLEATMLWQELERLAMLWQELERLANATDGLVDDAAARRDAVARARGILETVLQMRTSSRRRRGKPGWRSTVP
jgi:hypothetical protein